MESTETITQARDISAFLDLIDDRYRKTAAGKSRYWLTAPAQPPKTTSESYKEFRPRYQRCVNRPNPLQMALSQKMIFKKALQAPKLPEPQLPTVPHRSGNDKQPPTTRSIRNSSQYGCSKLPELTPADQIFTTPTPHMLKMIPQKDHTGENQREPLTMVTECARSTAMMMALVAELNRIWTGRRSRMG